MTWSFQKPFVRFAGEVGVFESVDVIEFKFSFKNADALVVAKGKFQIGLI